MTFTSNLPQDKFKGELLHAYKHHSASNHVGKRVVVVGSATSGTYRPVFHLSLLLSTRLASQHMISALITTIMTLVSQLLACAAVASLLHRRHHVPA